VTDIFKRLHDAAEKASTSETGHRNAAAVVSGAFGVVRSRMEANTSPRWTTYDNYLRV